METNMHPINTLFLEALKASLNSAQVSWTRDKVSSDDLTSLLNIASIHHVVPMIFEAIYTCDAFQAMNPQQIMGLRRSVMQSIMLQTRKTEAFKDLFGELVKAGIRPCVVKGVICRGLYPIPDARSSGDEDLLIRPEDFKRVHEIFTSHGMQLAEPDKDFNKEFEVPYNQSNGPLYIELHKSLFPPGNEAYGNMNKFFDNFYSRIKEAAVGDGKYLTMGSTDHLLYLICHSFKHFLHSGFGIRQVCDIILFANNYGREIDWTYVLECCREIRADLFAASMFKIGEEYLVFNSEVACYPDEWRSIDVDETRMLQDLLDSGVFGSSDMSRKHSSNITLNAIIADKRGKTAKASIWSSIFLPIESMKKRFTYLNRFPFLLPVAWLQRVLIYKKQSGKKGSGNNAAESIQIGNQRVELMRQYGIIK